MMKKVLALLTILLPSIAHAQIVGTLPFQLQNGTTADATQVMADFNKILNDVNTNGAKNGVNTDITALNALVTPITPAQGGATVYFASTSGGTANAQTVASPTPTGFTLAVGKRVTFIAGFTNTGATTLNVNSTGATNVFRMTPAGPVALVGGEIVASNYIEAVYDGTQYQLYTDTMQRGGFGVLTTLASAATTDLGTIASHNVSITGTTTITSFGSSAQTGLPNYKIQFTGALTLTYNATSLIIPGSASIATAAGDTAEVQYLGSANWRVTNYVKANGNPIAGAAPTRQTFTSGTAATYTTPANVRWIRIRMVGGGGGGGQGGNTAQASGGTASTFSGGTLTAGGGAGGSSTNGGVGGAATNGNILSVGGSAGASANGATNGGGGTGGSSCFGGGGLGSPGGTTAGNNAATNSGSGGGGGSLTGASQGGAGGGASGACVEHVIATPAATYTYTVGTGGAGATGGGAGGGVGGNGAAGYIIVEEYY